ATPRATSRAGDDGAVVRTRSRAAPSPPARGGPRRWCAARRELDLSRGDHVRRVVERPPAAELLLPVPVTGPPSTPAGHRAAVRGFRDRSRPRRVAPPQSAGVEDRLRAGRRERASFDERGRARAGRVLRGPRSARPRRRLLVPRAAAPGDGVAVCLAPRAR